MGRRPTNRFTRIISLRGLRSETSRKTKEDTSDVSTSSRSWHPEEDDACISTTSRLDSTRSASDSCLLVACPTGKSVRFGDCKVRKYAQVMGEHPCCSVGCPLELGWEYESVPTLAVDDYEASRTAHLSSHDLRLTYEERREILQPKYSDGEVRRACRRLNRERRQKGMNEFFATPH
mmetsp:Transcript_95599/g.143209  ORF Transcript_95599/g.143209 Transcript_95599/m.143209 type:complete len:177 (-) Transcript_95599:40-570(-)